MKKRAFKKMLRKRRRDPLFVSQRVKGEIRIIVSDRMRSINNDLKIAALCFAEASGKLAELINGVMQKGKRFG